MKRVYKGRLISVYKKDVKLPNKYVATLEIVKHPGAALIVPFLSTNKIIMLKQLRPVVKAYLYEFPAGTLSKNEPVLSCAKRELAEETGYSSARFTKLGEIFPVPGYSTEKITIYKAERLKKSILHTEEDEVIQSIILTRKQILRLFKHKLIKDAKTICALALSGLIP